ncbi:MAG: asparaginase [Micrococcaceae bacterium]
MPETFQTKDAVELAVMERSNFIESRHIGSAIVVKDGKTLIDLGDTSALVLPRSTLKPLQAVAVLRAGVPLFGPEVALASASHVGSKWQMSVVFEMLKKAGVKIDDLQCPAAWPEDVQNRAEFIAAGFQKSPLAHMCSGKHASFLWACKENGWPLDTYLQKKHPLQRHIKATIEEFSDEVIGFTAVDGCGAPVPALSLKGLATAMGRLAAAPRSHAMDARVATVATTIMDYPEAIDGEGYPDAIVIEKLGIVAKSGVEGMYIAACEDGTAVAVKVLDGNNRVAHLTGISLLAGAGAIDVDKARKVLEEVVPPIMGGNKVVGHLVPSSKVLANLGA